MKILHILDHSLPLHSGYTFRSQNIFREQRKRGWQPVILTSPKHEQSWNGPWQADEQINGFHYYRTGAISHNGIPLEAEIRLMSALGKRITEVARQEKPDILHAHSPVLNAVPALWAGRKLQIPVVYEIRAFWEDAGVDHGTYRQDSAKYHLVRSFESWVCRRSDQIGVLCNGLKQDLIKRGIPPDKIAIIYNGVNVEDFSVGRPDPELAKMWNLAGKKVIGFIGSFYRYEGLDLLVQAFARVAANRSDVVLLLVGGGEMEQELKNQIKRLGLALSTPNSQSAIRNSQWQHPVSSIKPKYQKTITKTRNYESTKHYSANLTNAQQSLAQASSIKHPASEPVSSSPAASPMIAFPACMHWWTSWLILVIPCG